MGLVLCRPEEASDEGPGVGTPEASRPRIAPRRPRSLGFARDDN